MTSAHSIEQARPKLGQILKDSGVSEQVITRNGVPAGLVIPPDAVPMRVHATFMDLFPHATDLLDYAIQQAINPEDYDIDLLSLAVFKEIANATPPGIIFTGTLFIGPYYGTTEFDIDTIRDSLPVDHMWKLADHYIRKDRSDQLRTV